MLTACLNQSAKQVGDHDPYFPNPNPAQTCDQPRSVLTTVRIAAKATGPNCLVTELGSFRSHLGLLRLFTELGSLRSHHV